MPAFKVMANVKTSMNLDFIVTAEDADEAQKQVETLLDKLRYKLQIEMGERVVETKEIAVYDSMDMEHDEDVTEIQDVEEIDEND